MNLRRTGIRIQSLLFIVVLAVVSGSVYAGGLDEDPIVLARELIIQRRYAEAIEVLSDIVRQNPERLDEAEYLLRSIRGIRDSYNEIGMALIDVLENDPDNYLLAIEFIDQMNELDGGSNSATRDQLEQARRTAKLQVDRRQRDLLFAEAQALIAEGQFQEAVQVYLSGFEIQREEFYADSFPEDITRRVEELITAVNDFSLEASGLFSIWEDEFSRFTQELERSGGLARVSSPEPRLVGPEYSSIVVEALEDSERRILEYLRNGFLILDSLRNTVATAASIQNDAGSIIDYLNFIEDFVLGTESSPPGTGIEGVVQTVWLSAIEEFDRDIGIILNEAAEQTRSFFTDNDYNRVMDRALAGIQIARTGRLIDTELREGYIRIQESDANVNEETITRIVLEFQSMYTQSYFEDAFTVVAREDRDSATAMNAALPERNLRRIDEYRDFLALFQRNSMAMLETITVADARSGIAARESEILSEYRRWAESMRGRIETERQYHVAHIVEWYRAGISESLSESLSAIQQARAYADGVQNDAGVFIRYPDRALGELDKAAEYAVAADSLSDDFEAALESISDLRDTDEWMQGRQLLSVFRIDSGSYRTTISQLRSQAEQRIADAERYRQEAERFVEQSRDAARDLDIDLARSRFEQAKDAYFFSLELQEDAAFRADVDAVIFDLGEAIRAAQNEIVVNEVRGYLTQARDSYNHGDFNEALIRVSEAETVWATTNTVENQEVVTLKNRISLATTLSQERDLSEYDPLYPTMSQLLNLARLDIEEGTRLFQAGNFTAAESRFQSARSAIENILYIKPYNFEARILQIRISQITQADQFQELFNRRFTDSVNRIGPNTPFTELTEILTELQVLAQINPQYPRIQQFIQSLEIRLGLREDPLTQEKIAESNRLLEQARTLSTNTNDRAQITAALNLLEQAIILNRDNQQAQILADALRIRLGGQASFALTTADEQLFRRAESLFIEGSLAQAYAIVLQLLQTTQNQGYPPLLSLRDRIERRL